MEQHGRVCSKCDVWKPAEAYKRDATKKDGLNSSCKVCNPYNSAKVNKAKAAAWTKAWKKNNPELAKAKMAKSRLNYREKAKITNKSWRDRNPFRVEKNPDKRRAYHEAWRQNNRDKTRLYSIAYRAKRRANDHVHGSKRTCYLYILKLLALQCYKCPVCKSSLKEKYHVDHIQPVSKGGTSKESNLQLLCPSCNHRKSDKDPFVFMQSRGMLL